ncbi:hypothetical protein BDV29DRAFT_159545 [Aspergillus leporis]|jgi:4,5-dihydroxyphthalate decarboxylase|uniref:Uncharacterized protein n=1 Tax=Aspergillus leporis TaxID=41062 RepID=A0A5N5WW26_9EURO|nr:hypothetical protein BDV29DRAFT_159545 [Aspergillus leporis]
MKAAVWIRGAPQDMGVDPATITWAEGAFERPAPHGNATPKPLLRPVNRVSNEMTKLISQCLEDGDVAATIGAEVPSCLGRAPHIRHQFPDIRQTTKQRYLQSKVFPIMHLRW